MLDLLCAHCLTGQCVHFWRGDQWTGEKHTVIAITIYKGDAACADCIHVNLDDVAAANEGSVHAR